MAYVLNPFTTKLDATRSNAELDARYLKLDQTTPQTVVDGIPIFEDGICFGNGNTKLILNTNSAELWVNGTLVQSWTVTPVAGTTGSPMGMLLTLTYS